MDPRLQRRVQRYGWDRAVAAYEEGWRAQLEPAHSLMLEMVALQPGERVLDVACGTGLVSFRVAAAVGEQGTVVGTDISGEMVESARRGRRRARLRQRELRAQRRRGAAVRRRELRCRRLRPRADVRAGPGHGARARCAGCSGPAAGRRRRCGARGATAAGPRSSRSPTRGSPPRSARCSSISAPATCSRAASRRRASPRSASQRLLTTLHYASAEDALGAVFRGGPVALAYSRFDEATRRAVHAEYLNSIAAYRAGDGYRVPGEFVVAAARAPSPRTDQSKQGEGR